MSKQNSKPTTNTKNKTKEPVTKKQTTSVASSDVDPAEAFDESMASTTPPPAQRRNSSAVSSTSKTNQDHDANAKAVPESETDSKSSAGSARHRSRADSSTPKDKPLKSALRTPSATKKPSIVGIVGARRVGVKWRMMIRNGGSGVVDDAGEEEEEKVAEVANKTYKDRVNAVLMSSDASMLTQAPSRRSK